MGDSVPIYTVAYVPWARGIGPKPYAIGTVLVQYDPQQMSAGTDQAKALVRIYVDGVAGPDMTWDPLPNQKPQSGQAAAQVGQRDLEERENDCTNGTTSRPSTTLLTTIMPAKTPVPSTSTLSSVPMSYGVLWGATCLQATTLTGIATTPQEYCTNYSFTYTNWTSWPATGTPAEPGNGLGLIECQTISPVSSTTLCVVPSLMSDESAIMSDLSSLNALGQSLATISITADTESWFANGAGTQSVAGVQTAV